MEERRRMMDMLRKFEDEGGVEDLLENEEEEDRDDLAERLGNINIDSASASDLWNALSLAERDSFLSAVRDPGSAPAQELLRSAGIEFDIISPWWEAPETLADETDTSAGTAKKFGKRPIMEQIPGALLRRLTGPDTGPPLLYNICSVFIAYAYVTRHLGISPLSQSIEEDDSISSRHLIRSLVPFLVEKRSNTLFNSMDDVVTHMWPRLVDDKEADRASFVSILRDAVRLLTPRRVALVDTSSSPSSSDLEEFPQRDALLALSDLITLFRSRSGQAKETPASHKLRFYAAHVALLPTQLLSAFSAEVGARAHSIELEVESNVQSGGTRPEPRSNPAASVDNLKNGKRPAIEEL